MTVDSMTKNIGTDLLFLCRYVDKYFNFFIVLFYYLLI